MVFILRFPVSSICFSLRLPKASTTLSKGPFAVHCLPDAFETFFSKKKRNFLFSRNDLSGTETPLIFLLTLCLFFSVTFSFWLLLLPSPEKCWNPSEFWSTDSSVSLTPSPELVILQIKYKGIYSPYFPFS